MAAATGASLRELMERYGQAEGSSQESVGRNGHEGRGRVLIAIRAEASPLCTWAFRLERARVRARDRIPMTSSEVGGAGTGLPGAAYAGHRLRVDPVSDREHPGLTSRSSTSRARPYPSSQPLVNIYQSDIIFIYGRVTDTAGSRRHPDARTQTTAPLRKARAGWWLTPPRYGIRRLINPWASWHLRALRGRIEALP
jgi:hypothetical protein